MEKMAYIAIQDIWVQCLALAECMKSSEWAVQGYLGGRTKLN